jgi:hypothetical protein
MQKKSYTDSHRAIARTHECSLREGDLELDLGQLLGVFVGGHPFELN